MSIFYYYVYKIKRKILNSCVTLKALLIGQVYNCDLCQTIFSCWKKWMPDVTYFTSPPLHIYIIIIVN